ncbi:hypothetical protein IG631_14835 [Alternaria alternata]|nr:hypothetical protein IG631_14835 [Alternaria alternata]
MNDAPTNRSARRRWGRMELGRAIALVRGETVDLAFTTTSEWNVGDEEKLGRPHQSRPVPTETWLTFLSIPFLAQQQHQTSTSSPSIPTLLQDIFFQDSDRSHHRHTVCLEPCLLLQTPQASWRSCMRVASAAIIRQPYQHHPTSYISAASSPLQPQMTFSKNMSC